MKIKINVPPVKKREETTETSLESLVASYYYKKIKLERTRLAKYGDYLIINGVNGDVGSNAT